MDEVRDKMKGLMKKVKPFSSSSSGKFKGQGRVLGSSSSSSSPSPSQPPSSNPRSLPSRVSNISEPKFEHKESEIKLNFIADKKPENGFDPFSSLITSGERNPNGYSLKGFECPVCAKVYNSEEEVSDHIEICLNSSTELEDGGENQLQACVSGYVSGKPSDGSLDVVLRVLRNVIKEPENAKFRKMRLGNPKIKEAIVDTSGGVELLESVGFKMVEENDEMCLVMDVPSPEQIGLVKNVILLLEPKKTDELPSTAPVVIQKDIEPKKIDRQTRVFFSVPESVAAKIELPDSFYNLSAEEVRKEAEARRKKLEESKLLIPKSFREKQAKAARKQYKKTLIRIQFPDGVVLQAFFSPREQTGALYEFVSSALKEPCLEFELLDPLLVKRRVIPHYPVAGQKGRTFEEEELVPAALIKFRPIETDSIVFTGLCNELLELIEPLVSDSAVPRS